MSAILRKKLESEKGWNKTVLGGKFLKNKLAWVTIEYQVIWGSGNNRGRYKIFEKLIKGRLE